MSVQGVWMKLVALVVAAQLVGCTAERLETRSGPTLAQIDTSALRLEIFTRPGDIYVLQRWSMDPTGTAVEGWGNHFGPDKRMVERPQTYHVSVSDIVLYQTTSHTTEPTVWAGVAVLFVTLGVVFVVVIANSLANFKRNFCIC